MYEKYRADDPNNLMDFLGGQDDPSKAWIQVTTVDNTIHFVIPYYFDYPDFKNWVNLNYYDGQTKENKPKIHVRRGRDWITGGEFYDARAQAILDGTAPVFNLKPEELEYTEVQHKPIKIKAVRLQKNVNLPDVTWSHFHEDHAFINLYGERNAAQVGASSGDWVVKGEKGWVKVLTDETFKQLYEGI